MAIIDLSTYHSEPKKEEKVPVTYESGDIQFVNPDTVRASCIVTGGDGATYKYDSFMVVGNGTSQEECMICMDIHDIAIGLVKLQGMFSAALSKMPPDQAQLIVKEYTQQLKEASR